MRTDGHQGSGFLAWTLILFLFVFSFNAYACLIPLSGTIATSMANGCSTPEEQPVRQLCDAFTTLGVESSLPLSSSHIEHDWLAIDHVLTAHPSVDFDFGSFFAHSHSLGSSSPPHQSLASTVLRI